MTHIEGTDADRLSCSISGPHFRSTIFVCMVFFLAVLIPLELTLMNASFRIAGAVLVLPIFFLVTAALSRSIFFAFAPCISFRGKPFIAAPRSRDLSWNGGHIRRKNGLGKLILIFIVSLVFPVALWCAAHFFLSLKTVALQAAGKNAAASLRLLTPLPYALLLLLFFIPIPFFCLFMRWLVSGTTGNGRFVLADSFRHSCAFTAAHVFLTLITAGIYWPVLVIKVCSHYAGEIRWLPFQGEKSNCGTARFSPDTKKTFRFLWGQALLCAITLGVYLPWAAERCAERLTGAIELTGC